MNTTNAPAVSRQLPATRRPGRTAARLLRLELRHNAMLWMLPVAIALFWLTTYRKAMAMPPLWNLRATSMQSGTLLAFACPVAGAAAWTGSRETRRHTTEMVTVAARPRWARLLAAWAAATCWAMAGYLACLAVLYGVTAQQASWGGPLWWPAAVLAASLPAFSAAGFAAGTLLPSRFTAPLATVAAFFVVALSTQLIAGSQSYWQVSPLVTGPWDTGPDAGVATFYPYLPDLPIAQVMFLAGLTIALLAALALPRGSGGRGLRAAAAAVTTAGLLAAGTAVALAGTGKLDAHGMITIPALHDAASDRPVRFTPACSHTAIPVCLNPAYASYLPATVTAVAPALSEIAGLPGAPVRISQAAATYQQQAGNAVSVRLDGPPISGRPPVYHLLLPDQLLGPTMTTSELAAEVRSSAGPAIVASVIADRPGASQAQHAVTAGLIIAAGLPLQGLPPGTTPAADSRPGVRSQPPPEVAPGSPAYAAARRFAALAAPARHAWLMRHLTALRAGRITLRQLP
ncbi:MAG: hypothetical protein JOY82_27075 [Streptosporangiaceae bacterium]|nr:hypothetical protein [Streptosporangiaceae bacterium]MBV9858147.1 hypothetical protein [Streptosporangiaceae bacterium]